MLEALMHVAINGHDLSQCQSLIHVVAKQWLAKPRRHLAKIPARDKLPVQVTTTADASVQVDTERLDPPIDATSEAEERSKSRRQR